MLSSQIPTLQCGESEKEELQRALGWDRDLSNTPAAKENLRNYITLQLASAGLLPPDSEQDQSMTTFSAGILESLREKNRLLSEYRAPVDSRIENFLNSYFADVVDGEPLRLPGRTLTLDRHGMARELSLPAGGHEFQNELVSSYRCANGVLNNPRADRRTTAGTFHVVEGGLPIPSDKRIVPKNVFVNLFRAAMTPPDDMMLLPYTSTSSKPSLTWVSLLLRPIVCPEVPGFGAQKTMETRFFAPGSLISNLDFVETIFGNAGDPLSSRNDAGLDVLHWSGHTGCVILATHLTSMTKKELGLPHYDDASERQRHDSMCWKDPEEKYNDGGAFKLTCRDESGVVVTLIADNYYGYCKKEVKTQLSYATNLMGGCEEEHSGGALAFASYSLGDEFQVNSRRYNGRRFADVAREYDSFIDVKPEGYGIDRFDPTVVYIPENAKVTLIQRCVTWTNDGKTERIPLSPANVYIAPSGYKIRLEKHPAAPSWRLVGSVGEGIFCHKPCTVSGGGKSEISKSLRDYMLYGPIFVTDREKDFAKLDEIFSRTYHDRWSKEYTGRTDYTEKPSRPVLDPSRSLGSVIQLLTPSPDYNDEYNQWLREIPEHVYSMALIIKRFIRSGMEQNWHEHFGVDIVNGSAGHELKIGDRSLVGTYLRVGWDNNRWRTFKLRQDFIAADKVQREDDISASVVVPADVLGDVGKAITPAGSYKFVENCEYRLFQRPDDAVHRGLDKQTELDLSRPGSFISNFEPLTTAQAREIVEDAIEFDKFTAPMASMLAKAAKAKDGYVVSTANPRIVNGAPTKNPRYLQDRPDMVNSRDTYVAMRGMQLHRGLAEDAPIHAPVGAVLSGRRNNPPDLKAGFRSLAVYSPLHYQELPELLMDYVCSLTGKSPSTTGAGSEGALTKGPFNALMPSVDLNSTVVSLILTGLGGFSTAAGHVGPRFEVGHDISLLIPEVWCRLGPEERDPAEMIRNKMLEKVEDFDHGDLRVPASRLGYRITTKFVRTYLARVFDNPSKVFTPEILQPELQDMESYVDGILHITEAQKRVALAYMDDGGYELACPPLKAILNIMAYGEHEGKTASDPEIRELFTRESLLKSDWYAARLKKKQIRDIDHWKAFEARLQTMIEHSKQNDSMLDLELSERLAYAAEMRSHAESSSYMDELVGTIGADPMQPSLTDPSMVNRLATSQ
ncbi:hypothetical protein RMSM_03106 [Rhodopirellula maiorica SM1]|uniref:PPi-type phosphoenolpyruvate carboxykinase lobe 2 domain-containing protein n=1 Tax=Rhodopirellula maiorica SM1 TaxID=1265738 RepID=M5RKW1_9BACT|nr:hypothetical protein [Rhodopirellula maiorica]EMI19968.1 hypothetical protein RMSM_03106 [Rhodopirellula maiorica SM1]